ncbi:2-oxoacid:acceptor oxidoreductase subunit alpha [Lentisphaerota bacterium ZTH]|nr:2-oxoacid:acceptor oxidoreductase subunit alpha [Lentisphaerota bacterium]WET06575.1 2-oxoacid:acceptor oxidoreductase subunit alpha [Lentisphaerota bacterium ZTH]
MDLVIRIAGEAGQGVVSAGDMLVNAFAKLDLYVFTYRSYMSRIRGGLNWYDIRISDRPLSGMRGGSDILFALTDDALTVLYPVNSTAGVVFYNTSAALQTKPGLHNIDFAKESGHSRMINSYAVGIVFGLLGMSKNRLAAAIKREFTDKAEDIIQQNNEAAARGWERCKTCGASFKLEQRHGRTPDFLISGAGAIGLSAARSGVKFVASYPMTPATATFTYLAGAADKYNIVVEQAEDEIAAVNMICGAAYAGVPSLAATSGGGFALMCEGLSLAGMTENPIVILIAMRPGPATGLPTRTAQEDLRFALHAGHGEFPRAIYAPGNVEQCYQLTRTALETAHKYQTPVIILTDQYLQDSIQNIEPLEAAYDPIDRRVELKPKSDYKRYAYSVDGVSPRALPGGGALVVCDSDEHSEAGHLTEDFEFRVAQQNKRMRKLEGMKAEALPPTLYGAKKPEKLLVCWGSTYGICREAVDKLNSCNQKFAMLHFSQLWPLDASRLKKYFNADCEVFVLEGNFTGQFASMLKEQNIVQECKLITRYDGLPFQLEYIIEELEEYDN